MSGTKDIFECGAALRDIAQYLDYILASMNALGINPPCMGDAISDIYVIEADIRKLIREMISEDLKRSQESTATVLKAALAGITLAKEDELGKSDKEGSDK